MSKQIQNGTYIGKDKFANYRFRITSEKDSKSMSSIRKTNAVLNSMDDKLYSPVYANTDEDFGLITVHRFNKLDVAVGCVYSFDWKALISTNPTNQKRFVKIVIDNFVKIADAVVHEETEIVFSDTEE